MNVLYRNRAFTTELAELDLEYQIERYSHHSYWGPKRAVIRATGADGALWSLMERLRAPIYIYGKGGRCLWWGYQAELRGTARNPDRPGKPIQTFGVSIDSMYNRIAVAYNKVDLTTGVQERDTTAWADNSESQAEYGIRELLWSASSATATHAEAARDMKLEQIKYPIPVIEDALEEKTGAEIICRGWGDTLGSRYYANAGENSVDTATQVSAILTAKGQFINGITVRDLSGISIREERDGDASALYEITQLLEMGTTNFRRLLITIDQARHALIYEEPAKNSQPHTIKWDASLLDANGAPVDSEICPVAFWARRSNIIPSSVNASLLADPGLKFIEETEYIVAEDRLTYKARGDPDPWQFPKVRDG